MAFRQQNSTATTPVSKMMRGLGEVSLGKTPGSAGRNTKFSKTPTGAFNNRRPLGRRELTPSRSNANAAQRFDGDRMIPSRCASQLELASFLHSQSLANETMNTSKSAPTSPSKEELEKRKFMKMMRVKSSSDLGGAEDQDRILVFRKNNAPLPPVGHMNTKVLFTTCVQPSSTVKKSSRQIPSMADRILDAPNLVDDYYTELIDWGEGGLLAAALGSELYLWNPDSGDISVLIDQDSAEDMITAAKWSNEGRFLAVGGESGVIRLFDPSKGKELRKLTAPRLCRATCMAWKDHMLSIGYKSGQVVSHDVRIKESVVGVLEGHSQPVCGVHWSPDGAQFATGGSDNLVHVWDSSRVTARGQTPTYVLNDHTASVKAVQFSNFKRGLLATGGGTTDPTVKLWDTMTGALTKTIKVDSQVTAIRFNKDYKEMIVGLGRTANTLKIFKHPNYQEIANIAGHTDRVLGLSMSPCGQYVMSASADETLRLWHLFKVDKSTQRLQHHRSKLSTLEAMR
ncbi:unnamed protein product, partial [Mesorhabditis spiculigera]